MHCLIIQVKIILWHWSSLVFWLLSISIILTFGSFHSSAMMSFIYVYISFAHDSTQYSHSSFNLQPQPFIPQITCLDSPAQFSTNTLFLYIHTVCLTLYWIYYSILYLFSHKYFPTRQWTPADEGKAFNSLTLLHNWGLVKGCWKRNELMTYSCFVSPWFTSQWTLHGSSRK